MGCARYLAVACVLLYGLVAILNEHHSDVANEHAVRRDAIPNGDADAADLDLVAILNEHHSDITNAARRDAIPNGDADAADLDSPMQVFHMCLLERSC